MGTSGVGSLPSVSLPDLWTNIWIYNSDVRLRSILPFRTCSIYRSCALERWAVHICLMAFLLVIAKVLSFVYCISTTELAGPTVYKLKSISYTNSSSTL